MGKELHKDKCHTDLLSIMYQPFSIHYCSFSAIFMKSKRKKDKKDLVIYCYIGQ